MKLNEIENKLNDLLKVSDFAKMDISLNGLQVGNRDADVKKVAFAVDACLQSVQMAVESNADLLVVHHGLFWGRPIAINGAHYQRVATLIKNDVGLYACHLPLDAHLELGNNAQMAMKLGIKDFVEFDDVGVIGKLPKPMTSRQIMQALVDESEFEHCHSIEFGKKTCETVAFVSGSAARDLDLAIAVGADIFVTGERSHTSYHTCKEMGMNMLCLGHYATEVYGVKALKALFESWGLETVFLDIPTSL